MAKVKVKIAVAVDRDGNWNASGWGTNKQASHDKEAMECAVDMVGDGEARYFVIAELDMPTEAIVPATEVQPAI